MVSLHVLIQNKHFPLSPPPPPSPPPTTTTLNLAPILQNIFLCLCLCLCLCFCCLTFSPSLISDAHSLYPHSQGTFCCSHHFHTVGPFHPSINSIEHLSFSIVFLKIFLSLNPGITFSFIIFLFFHEVFHCFKFIPSIFNSKGQQRQHLHTGLGRAQLI